MLADFSSFIEWSRLVGTVVAFLSILLSIAGTLGGVVLARRFGKAAHLGAEKAIADIASLYGRFGIGTDSTTQGVAKRLQEIKSELSRQDSISRSARWTTRGLTLGQYVVGGLLASSFLQEQLPHQLAGFLGVLVLLSTVIYQNFRPDRQMRLAEIQKVRLRALYGGAEEDLEAIADKIATAPTLDQIRRKLTSELSAIEGLNFEEERQTSGKTEQRRRKTG